MQSVEPERGALIVTFAFLLGQSTLAKFFKCMVGLTSQVAGKFRGHLKDYLRAILNIDEEFASWLS
jgi:hypothetical protein